MKTMVHAYRMIGAVCAIGAFHALGACSSDSSTSGDEDAGAEASTGGKHTGGAAGRAGSAGTAGRGGAGGASGAAGAAGATACTVAVATECDGAEDCPSGQHCCGEYNNGGYDKFGCYDSCAAAGDAGAGMGAPMMMGPILFELCHVGDTCEDSTAQCLTSPYLPSSLSRCLPSMLMGSTMGGTPDMSLGKAADKINCGEAVCGAGEECCVRQPLAPYCAPKGTTCGCTHTAGEGGGVPEGGTPDASVPIPDAAPPVTPTKDATPDAPSHD
jgi:hypothetical protein